jgi:hypothetical protein
MSVPLPTPSNTQEAHHTASGITPEIGKSVELKLS